MKINRLLRPFVPGMGSNVSQDGLAVDGIFDAFSVSLNPVAAPSHGNRNAWDYPLMAFQHDTLLATFDEGGEFSTTINVRGFANLDAGTTAFVTVRALGKTTVKPIRAKAGGSDYQFSVSVKGRRSAGFLVHIQALLERDLVNNALSGGVLSVDSVDFEIKPMVAAAKKKKAAKSAK